MGRFMSDVARGQLLNTALENYTNYLKTKGTAPNPRTDPSIPIGAKRETITIGVIPFGAEDGTKKVNVRTSKSGHEVLSTTAALTGRFSASGEVDLPGFRPAQLALQVAKSANRTRTKSKYTGLYYIKYGGETYRASFGAKTATEEFQTAQAEVTAAARAKGKADGGDYVRVHVRDEVFAAR